MIKTMGDMWRKRAILAHFVSFQLTTSYRTKAFGFLWALLDPLLFMGVYFVVFGVVLAHRPLWFMLHIYIGVISFRFLSTSLSQSAQIVKSQAGLIREIAFPKVVLPASVVATRLFDYVAGWLAAIAIALIFHVNPHPFWALLPFFIVIQTMFVLGLSLATAYIGVFFADIVNLIDVGTRLWFYLSPVLYVLFEAKQKVAGEPIAYYWYMINPMTSILQNYEFVVFRHFPAPNTPQDLLHLAQIGPASVFLWRSLLEGLLMLLIGLYIFSRAEGQLSKYV
jgi:lipopolysaccharide transport system permease protein/teichoic acid transport system permease protein